MRYLITLFFAYSLFAGTYDDSYNIQQNSNVKSELDIFMHGDFKEIIRFDMLKFEGTTLINSDKNNQTYKKILNAISMYTKNDEDIRIKIIGHTNEATDNADERRADSDTYADNVIGLFSYSLDKNTSEIRSKDCATYIQDTLVADNVKKELTVVEYRDGKDMAFIDSTTKGRDLSNRVMVTIYLIQKEEQIIETEPEPVVQEIVAESVVVEEENLDNDFDGISNINDNCPNTPSNTKVTDDGCSYRETLVVHFATKEYTIYPYSAKSITKFATYLKHNPKYNIEIIGHTDNIGSLSDNMLLSQNRAIATKNALIQNDIEESRMKTKGKGELSPLVDNLTKANRQKNRRIEVKIYNNK